MKRGPGKKLNFPFIRFAGVSLGGGKGRKTSLALLDYFPRENKVFLSELSPGLEESEKKSADTALIEKLESHKKNLKVVALDAPLKLPKCLRCRLTCPGHEKCTEPEIKWMWQRHKKRDKSKRPNKIFTPYTERCVEQHILSEVHGDLATDHALGANRAPLAARALYLQRRIKRSEVIEVLPKVSFYRLATELGLRKKMLTAYRQLNKGEEIRQMFLEKWSEKDRTFVYHRDFKTMVRDVFAFDAFLSAYTAFLYHYDGCEKPPKSFPPNEAWIEYPREDFEEVL